MAWEFEAAEALRAEGWIPEDGASDVWGLEKREMVSNRSDEYGR